MKSGSKFSPAHAHGNRAQVSRNSVAFAVEIAELGVDIHLRAYLAGDAAAEVFAKFVQAGMEKVSIHGQVVVRARSPPKEEGVAG